MALAISRPEFIEEAFQYGNVQLVEIEKIAPVWSQILMVVCRRPYVTKATLDVDLLERLFPTLFKRGDVEPDIPAVGVYRSDAVNSGVPFREKVNEFFDRAGLVKYADLSKIDWKAATSLPRRPYWGHQGQCACGKRVYLFARCWNCKRKDRFEEEASVEAYLQRTHVQSKPRARDSRPAQRKSVVTLEDSVSRSALEEETSWYRLTPTPPSSPSPRKRTSSRIRLKPQW